METRLVPFLIQCIDVFSLQVFSTSTAFLSALFQIVLLAVRLIIKDHKLLIAKWLLTDTTDKMILMIVFT